MTIDVLGWAAGVSLRSGRYRGWTLGELAGADLDYLGWISRAWIDPGVRAGARVLLDRVDADVVGDLNSDLLATAIAAARASTEAA